ncbi:HAD family phosphatase [Patescibacteria group bacterium]|nr:HAD family phosphatase [Patescibacteria group bacterium]
MIKAVIFDIGGVLVGSEWQVIYKKIAKELKISEEKVREISSPLLEKWNVGRIDEKEFWKGFEKRLGRKIDPGFTKDLWFRSYQDYTKDINGSWEILTELKNRGIRLVLISNIIPPHVQAHIEVGRIDRLKKLGFKIFVWSCEEGLRKPDPKIYEVMLKKLGLPAKACVFVDDKLANIEAAKKLGIQGIHFQSPQQLREDLTKLGLL